MSSSAGACKDRAGLDSWRESGGAARHLVESRGEKGKAGGGGGEAEGMGRK